MHARVALPGWTAPLLLGLAFVAGFGSDAFTAQDRIHLLPPALLGLLAWNLAVYLFLAWQSVSGARQPGLATRLLEAALRRIGGSTTSALAPDRARAEAAQLTARLVALLHGAALAWALGVLASIYWHGIFLEVRAGWSSTFIRDPQTLRTLLDIVLWPAVTVAGIELPGAAELARLRFESGGENAARWIHWHALNVACVVLLPRALLALKALHEARQPAAAAAAPTRARVLPYSYQLSAPLQAGLRELLRDTLGPQLALTVEAPVAQAAEDDIERWAAAPAADETVVLLFALTATPEAETHGAFVRAVAARQPAGARRLVLVDESGFRARFGAEPTRLAQRRAAWERLLQAVGERPAFVDLAHPARAKTQGTAA